VDDRNPKQKIGYTLKAPETALTRPRSRTTFRPAGALPGCTERAGTREVRRWCRK